MLDNTPVLQALLRITKGTFPFSEQLSSDYFLDFRLGKLR